MYLKEIGANMRNWIPWNYFLCFILGTCYLFNSLVTLHHIRNVLFISLLTLLSFLYIRNLLFNSLLTLLQYLWVYQERVICLFTLDITSIFYIRKVLFNSLDITSIFYIRNVLFNSLLTLLQYLWVYQERVICLFTLDITSIFYTSIFIPGKCY